MNSEALIIAEKLVKEEEAWRARIYPDTVGKITGGWGHNFSDNKISLAVGQLLFEEDMADAQREVMAIYGPVINEIDPVRLAVLLDLSFNLSYERLEGFHNFIAAIKAKNWFRAASELEYKDSTRPEIGYTLWWQQVKSRGPKLQKILRTGEL